MPGQSIAEVQADPEFQALSPQAQQIVLQRMFSALPPTSDAPLESAINPLEEVATLGLGGLVGTAVGGLGAKGLSQLRRFTLGTPGVRRATREAVVAHAPEGLRPASSSIDDIAHVMRSGEGRAGLGAARQRGLDPIEQDLARQTAVNRAGAAEGLTGTYAKQAIDQAPDPSARFGALLQELADANRAGFNPGTGGARTGVGSLGALRSKAAVLDDLKDLLSPAQFKQVQDIQRQYATGSSLMRLFKPSGGRRDVLRDNPLLQQRAKTMQGQLPAELFDAILPGGPVATDTARRFGLGGLGGTVGWRAPRELPWDDVITSLGMAGGAYGGVKLSEALRSPRRRPQP